MWNISVSECRRVNEFSPVQPWTPSPRVNTFKIHSHAYFFSSWQYIYVQSLLWVCSLFQEQCFLLAWRQGGIMAVSLKENKYRLFLMCMVCGYRETTLFLARGNWMFLWARIQWNLKVQESQVYKLRIPSHISGFYSFQIRGCAFKFILQPCHHYIQTLSLIFSWECPVHQGIRIFFRATFKPSGFQCML